MPKSKTKTQELSLGSITSRFSMPSTSGTVVATTIASEDIGLINRYRNSSSFSDLKTFVRHMVKDGLSWMRRMINGTEMFELHTMDYWKYDKAQDILILKNPNRSLRDNHVIYDMSFCAGTITEFLVGQGMILSSAWYQTTSLPLVVIELIACMDLLYRQHHGGRSPASDTGVPRVALTEKGLDLEEL